MDLDLDLTVHSATAGIYIYKYFFLGVEPFTCGWTSLEFADNSSFDGNVLGVESTEVVSVGGDDTKVKATFFITN